MKYYILPYHSAEFKSYKKKTAGIPVRLFTMKL